MLSVVCAAGELVWISGVETIENGELSIAKVATAATVVMPRTTSAVPYCCCCCWRYVVLLSLVLLLSLLLLLLIQSFFVRVVLHVSCRRSCLTEACCCVV